MKTKFNIGDRVFALNGDETKPFSINICTIDYIGIDRDKIVTYGLIDEDGTEWGDTQEEQYVSKNINDLIKYLKL
jgi:hypothetical protein